MSTQDKKFVLLTGGLSSLEQDVPPSPVPEEQVLQSLNALSIRLRRNPKVHPFPDPPISTSWYRGSYLRRLIKG